MCSVQYDMQWSHSTLQYRLMLLNHQTIMLNIWPSILYIALYRNSRLNILHLLPCLCEFCVDFQSVCLSVSLRKSSCRKSRRSIDWGGFVFLQLVVVRINLVADEMGILKGILPKILEACIYYNGIEKMLLYTHFTYLILF